LPCGDARIAVLLDPRDLDEQLAERLPPHGRLALLDLWCLTTRACAREYV
jgi:hypothetical protein